MAFQLAATIAIGAFLGKKLDGYFQTERPYFTALCSVVFLFAGFYVTLKDILFTRPGNRSKKTPA
jgi:F0F1-type ATP synthase assembly protein I